MSIDKSGAMKAPGDFALLGVTLPTGLAADEIRVRTSRDGSRWGRFTPFEFDEVGPDADSHESGPRTSMPLWTGKSRFFDLRAPETTLVHLIDPGADPVTPLSFAGASPSKPGIITRAGWGADESIRKGKPEYAEPLRMAVVHHTATADSYPKSQSDDIVRGIYAYHVKTNGWDDIGYNFLVDRYGQIFEGRFGGMDKTVQGAHSLGFNRNTTGISIIGNFASSRPPEVAMNSLKRIISWRLDQGFVDPAGSLTYVSNGSNKWKKGVKVSLKAVSGHRDVGKTVCPSDPLYEALPALRTAAANDGLPKLYDAKASRSIVTPNADGVSDSTKLTGRFPSPVGWKVDVIDSAGRVFHSLSGSGTTISVNWYGKDSAGAAVPHGSYRFRITGKNGTGSVRTSDVAFEVWRYPNGSFFQTASKITYILEKGVLRHPSHWHARSTRYNSAEVISVSNHLTDAYKKSTHLGFRDGSIVRADGEVYVISDGSKRPTTTPELALSGFDPNAIIATTAAALASNRDGESWTSAQGYFNGAALKDSTGQEARVMSGIAHRFYSSNARRSWQIRDVDLAQGADGKITEGLGAEQIGFRDGTLVRAANTTTIYVISDAMRRPFSSTSAFRKMGYKSSNIRTVTPDELAFHPEGKPL